MLEAMTAFEAQRPSGWLHCGEEDGQLMAGCVRSRTAASEQRNSWNPWVPDRQLCGSRNDRSGSGGDRQLFGLTAGKPTLKVRFPKAATGW